MFSIFKKVENNIDRDARFNALVKEAENQERKERVETERLYNHLKTAHLMTLARQEKAFVFKTKACDKVKRLAVEKLVKEGMSGQVKGGQIKVWWN